MINLRNHLVAIKPLGTLVINYKEDILTSRFYCQKAGNQFWIYTSSFLALVKDF